MSADLLDRIADQIPSMLAYWDADLRCRYANQAYRTWFGIEPQALVGRTLPELLGPELYRLNRPHIEQALAGVEQRFERDVPGPSGVRRSIAHYLPDRVDGRVAGFIAHVIDVTPLKVAEDRLRVARRRTAMSALDLRRRAAALREAQRLAQVGSWEWQFAADRLVWSPELCRIFGLAPNATPPPYAEQGALFLPASWATLQQAVSTTRAGGAPYTLELEFHHPDGSVHMIEARGEAIRDAAARVVGLRGTVHDITLKRRLDEARVRAQVAEAANRLKTELLSRASHELRTPLNAIIGFGSLLRESAGLPADQLQWVDHIIDGGRHLLALTNDLLDLSASETGQLSLTLETVDLEDVATRVCRMMEPEARRAGMRIEQKPAPETSRLVKADSVRARQIVTNLLSNAIKYGREGTAVMLSIEAAPPGMRSLHVEDTGPGLTEVQLALLFKPFERLDAPRTTVPGAGLGLAVSQQLARLMNGRVEVRSEPGVGSCFTLVLPAAGDRD
ncbi:MAG TPA: ATP-binding protein [Burkholderiaceae bacterium]